MSLKSECVNTKIEFTGKLIGIIGLGSDDDGYDDIKAIFLTWNEQKYKCKVNKNDAIELAKNFYSDFYVTCDSMFDMVSRKYDYIKLKKYEHLDTENSRFEDIKEEFHKLLDNIDDLVAHIRLLRGGKQNEQEN